MTRPTDLVVLVVLNAVALALIAFAWSAVSTRALIGEQVAYVNVGVAGVLVAGLADVLFVLSARRAVDERAARVNGLIVQQLRADER